MSTEKNARKIEKIDNAGTPTGEEYDAIISRLDGKKGKHLLTAKQIANANWRNDSSLSFSNAKTMIYHNPTTIK